MSKPTPENQNTLNRRNNQFLLSGNEAIFEGLKDAGVGFGSMYPGTPVSEVGDYIFSSINHQKSDIVFDYSINEKVALESAIGAAWTGVRSACIFKHLGMNIAADPLHSIMYSGTGGKNGAGMVIICGGDPESSSSTNAADIRMYSMHTHLPILCPSNVQEMYDFTIIAFELSEFIDLPIMVYTTSKLSFSTGIINKDNLRTVSLTKINNSGLKFDDLKFKRDFNRYINAIHFAIRNQQKLLHKIKSLKNLDQLENLDDFIVQQIFKGLNHTHIETNVHTGIITAGIPYLYVNEVLEQSHLKYNIPVLKLNQIYPVNSNQIENFIQKYELTKLIIVEELEPFIELQVKSILFNEENTIKIFGKSHFPNFGALNHALVAQSISSILSDTEIEDKDYLQFDTKLSEVLADLPIREPTFCPGCSHRNVFYALRKISDELKETYGLDVVFGGDIGCYTMGMSSPYSAMDWLISMGAGIGIANGVARTLKKSKNHNQRLVAIIGDSTFFHTGLQALLNILKENLPITVIILNNYYVAMTGHQPTLTSKPQDIILKSQYGFQNQKFALDKFVKNMGVQSLTVIDGYDIPEIRKKLTRIIQKQDFNAETSQKTEVVIVNAECALMKRKEAKKKWALPRGKEKGLEKYILISQLCPQCHECYVNFGCTAIKMVPDEKRGFRYIIDESACMKEYCEACLDVCPNDSIAEILIWKDLEEDDSD